MHILGTNDPEEALTRLATAIDGLTEAEEPGDRNDAQGLRAALGVGIPPQEGAEARRRAAMRLGLFAGAKRTQYIAEDRAIKRLVDLLFEEAHQRAQAGESDNEQPDDDQPDTQADRNPHDSGDHGTEPTEADDEPLAPGRATHWRDRLVGYWKRPIVHPLMGLVFLAVILLASTLMYRQLTAANGDTGGKEVSSGAQPSAPPATINSSADESIDNTRGWGPDRDIFTIKAPAPSPVFNSIIDNPKYGDERNFMRCKDKEDGDEAYADELIARDGHTYTCFAPFHNAIAPNMEEELGEEGLLQNARLTVALPPANTYNPGVSVLLSADNSITVWDSTNFISPKRLTITYVRRSAWMITKHTPEEGLPLDETYDGDTMTNGILREPGALIGSWSRDGRIGQPAGYVTFDVRVELGE